MKETGKYIRARDPEKETKTRWKANIVAKKTGKRENKGDYL